MGQDKARTVLRECAGVGKKAPTPSGTEVAKRQRLLGGLWCFYLIATKNAKLPRYTLTVPPTAVAIFGKLSPRS